MRKSPYHQKIQLVGAPQGKVGVMKTEGAPIKQGEGMAQGKKSRYLAMQHNKLKLGGDQQHG
jgi:hypothetical protein